MSDAEIPPAVEQRASVVILPGEEMPTSGNLWQMHKLGCVSEPTVFRAAIPEQLCEAAVWLPYANDSRVNLLTPGKGDQTRNAFSVHLDKGKENTERQSAYPVDANTWHPHTMPADQRWHARWRITREAPGLSAIFGEVLPIPADQIHHPHLTIFCAAPGTRTPLHKDKSSSVLMHLCGRKRVLCFTQEEVNREPRLSEDVKTYGATHHHCAQGTQEDIFGTVHPTQENLVCFGGWCAELQPGDILVIPSGVYHDVASVGDQYTMSCAYRLQKEDSDGV